MKIELQNVLPEEIEKRSFEMIGEEMGETNLSPEELLVLKRVIHTSADFEYEKNLVFSHNAVEVALEALRNGAVIVTDTQMAKAGINKTILGKLGSEVICYMSDEDVAATAKANGTTRAVASMDKLTELDRDFIVAIGNAPTALVRLHELITEGKIAPKLVIGVPVGFVNVVESKEIMLQTPVPSIIAKGRKGGSNVAAAICNALLYQILR